MRHFLVPMLAACLCLTPSGGKAQDGGKKAQGAAIAVIDFGYVDTSGEERDQRKEHETRLGNFMRALRDDLAKDGSSWRPHASRNLARSPPRPSPTFSPRPPNPPPPPPYS